jgi:hypoxanthine phosphoribosyltransferase
MIPAHLKPLFDAPRIEARVKELGGDITVWANKVWEQSHTDVLAIPVLRGGIFFFADLVRQISASVEIAPARTWAYEQQIAEGKDKPEMLSSVGVDIGSVPAKGRAVLIVDDICDSGRSLAQLSKALLASGAREVRTAVLVRRELPEQHYSPDWTGFTFPGTEWLVGYGMDDSERWRNLPGVYIITQR